MNGHTEIGDLYFKIIDNCHTSYYITILNYLLIQNFYKNFTLFSREKNYCKEK